MRYVDFLMRVKRYVSYYVEALEGVYQGKLSKDDAKPLLIRCSRDVARALNAFEANREDDSRNIHLCPVCNRLIHTKGEEDEAEFPARVGQMLIYVSDTGQTFEAQKCPRCGHCASYYEINHWE